MGKGMPQYLKAAEDATKVRHQPYEPCARVCGGVGLRAGQRVRVEAA